MATPDLISIAVPAFEEEGNLERLYADLCKSLEDLDWELIVIDDGSTDATFAVTSELAARDSRVRGVRLSRNFGHQYALRGGLREARGAAVVSMDADLQHPASVVPELIAHWMRGAKIVHTRRNPGKVSGWASVAGLVAFLFAANFVLLGFLGTYIGHIFDRVQGHPAYLIEQRTPDRS